jgi:hypothetical protein
MNAHAEEVRPDGFRVRLALGCYSGRILARVTDPDRRVWMESGADQAEAETNAERLIAEIKEGRA